MSGIQLKITRPREKQGQILMRGVEGSTEKKEPGTDTDDSISKLLKTLNRLLPTLWVVTFMPFGYLP